jgi:hypothetical protein
LTEAERQMFGPSTRQEIIFHVLRHDFHHGGELAVGMGATTCPPSGGFRAEPSPPGPPRVRPWPHSPDPGEPWRH